MTKEEILRQTFTEERIKLGSYPDSTLRPAIYRAMEEYAQQQTAELREMLKELVQWVDNIDDDGEGKSDWIVLNKAKDLLNKKP